jgi:hypothetical protein
MRRSNSLGLCCIQSRFFGRSGANSLCRLANVEDRLATILFRSALVLNTMPSYMPVIGIADERWKTSAARNSRHHLMPLTTDVLALVNR